MRIGFLGTAELACASLEALARLGEHQLVLVVTQPDRPQGRKLELAPPPVKLAAQQLGLPVFQPERIREPAAVERLRDLQPDLLVVVAYGQFLPATVLDLPPRGCVNVHTSLLPRWRGAAPIQSAILQGDSETGVTTMFLNEAMDAGDIILQRATPLLPAETSGGLHERLAALGAELLVETVARIAAGNAPRRAQDESGVTLARKILKEQGRIDWTRPAIEIERQVRAFNPWPSAFTGHGDNLLKIWRAEVVAGASGVPGQLQPAHVVGTGRDGLRLLEVQPAGRKRMSFAEFLRGHPLPPGAPV